MSQLAATKPELVSDIFHRVADKVREGEASIGNILYVLGGRAFGLIMLFLALPNALPIPMPPGWSTIFGVPLCLFSIQILLGIAVPQVPAWLARKSLPANLVSASASRSAGIIRRVEPFAKRRLTWLNHPSALRLIGLALLWLSLIVVVPIPGIHLLPGLALTLIALGMVFDDGILILLGLGIGIGGTVIGFYLAKGAAHWLAAFFSGF